MFTVGIRRECSLWVFAVNVCCGCSLRMFSAVFAVVFALSFTEFGLIIIIARRTGPTHAPHGPHTGPRPGPTHTPHGPHTGPTRGPTHTPHGPHAYPTRAPHGPPHGPHACHVFAGKGPCQDHILDRYRWHLSNFRAFTGFCRVLPGIMRGSLFRGCVVAVWARGVLAWAARSGLCGRCFCGAFVVRGAWWVPLWCVVGAFVVPSWCVVGGVCGAICSDW